MLHDPFTEPSEDVVSWLVLPTPKKHDHSVIVWHFSRVLICVPQYSCKELMTQWSVMLPVLLEMGYKAWDLIHQVNIENWLKQMLILRRAKLCGLVT